MRLSEQGPRQGILGYQTRDALHKTVFAPNVFRYQKSNAIVDVVLISKIVINIDFCTESHYVAATCMNLN